MTRVISTMILVLVVLIPTTLIINSYIAIEPIFYIFVFSLTGIISLILSQRKKRIWVPILFTYNAVDYVFVFSGVILIILNFLSSSLETEILKYCFSLILLFFLPGWMIIRFLNLTNKLNKISILTLSFLISMGLTAIIYTLVLIIAIEPTGFLLSFVYTGLSLIPITLRYTIGKGSDNKVFVTNRKKGYNLTEIITLVWITAFFIFCLLNMYPQIVNTPGHDMVRHYSVISSTKDNPDLFRSPYPWFHLSLGALNDVSDSEMWVFQTATSFLSIILILAFYSLAKAYLYRFNKYAHLLSAIVFSGFSGLGWIFYYQNIQPFISFNEQIKFLYDTYVATYYDIGLAQSQWLWIWFRPITIDFALTMMLLFLMKAENLSRKKYITLNCLLIVTLSLVHFPGLVLFVLIIFFLSILVPKIRLRAKYMALSLIISLPISALMFEAYIFIFGADYIPFQSLMLIVLELISIAGYFLLIYAKRFNLPISLDYKRIASIVLTVYGILLVYWLTNIDSVKDDIATIFSFNDGLYSVPISIFPELLGIAGFLSIPVIVFIIKRNKNDALLIFPIIFISMLIVGRIISFVIINYRDADYWERRLVLYLWITVSILSPFAIIKIINLIENITTTKHNYGYIKRVVAVLFIFFLVLGSMLSSFLSPEYQKLKNFQLEITDNERALLGDLENLDPHSSVLSVTSRSKSLAEYQLFNYNVGNFRDQIWPSSSPELPMNILNGLNSTALIYLNNQDLEKIAKNGYDNGYMVSHVVKEGPELQSNSKSGKIIQIPRLAPPSSVSNTVLVLPNQVSKSQYYAYDILSLGQYNFTTALLSDIPTIKQARILVVPNEEIANNIIQAKTEFDMKFEKLIILNLDGYGQIGKMETEHMNTRLNHSDLYRYEVFRDDQNDNPISFERQFDKPLDLSGYGYMKFKWVGEGKKDDFFIVRFSSTSNGSISYHFNTSSIGPKEILLPMDPDTRDNTKFDDMDIQKSGVERNFWSSISKINIITADSSRDSDSNIALKDLTFISASKADKINSPFGNASIDFQQSPVIHSTYPSSYKTGLTYDNNVPFVLQKKEQGYTIYYVNVYPILTNFHVNYFTSEEMYAIYGKLLGMLGIDIPSYQSTERSPLDLVTGGIAAFKNSTFEGNVNIESNSSTIKTDTAESEVNIDGKYTQIFKLSRILPIDMNQVNIKSNVSTMTGIYGFYTLSVLPNKTLVNFIGNPAVVSVGYANNEEKLLQGSNITITLDNAEVLSRQPKVMVDGISNFSQFYSYGELNDKLRVLNSYLDITGKISFNTKYADQFILIEKADFANKFKTGWTEDLRDNGNINLIKLDNLLKTDTISYIVLLIILCILYNLFLVKRINSKIKKIIRLK